ncbi:hypothetical protein TRVA0_001S00188 [Trichomonascus vanleenenianus]|uniref:uncharacterized protein n=1 Tax=Trichomonascus vanleenenianus TaxID=2268995 RepID=UPI003ECBA63B
MRSKAEVFLQEIEARVYKAKFVDRYNVIHNIRRASRLLYTRVYVCTNSRNRVIRALHTWRQNRHVGVSVIAKALAAPYYGYSVPCYYSNNICLRNVNEGFDIIKRYYYCIVHVKFDLAKVISDDKKGGLFIKMIGEIAENSRLQSVEIKNLHSYGPGNRDNIGELIKILKKFLKNPPRKLIIDLRDTIPLQVVQVLNKFPRNVTQLAIVSDAGKMNSISMLTANLVMLRISECYYNTERIQQLVTPHKSLCRLFLHIHHIPGKLKLPDSVTYVVIAASKLYLMPLTISGPHLKSLEIRQMTFSPVTFLFPELEYLSISQGRIQDTNGHRQTPYPKLKALEWENTSKKLDFIPLLELTKPVQSIALLHEAVDLRETLCRDLLFSKYLPPVVTLHLARNIVLRPEDLYFLQSLLGQSSTSKVYVTVQYSDISNPPNLRGISRKYLTLVSSSLKRDGGYFQDTYILRPDFVKARLPYIKQRFRHIFASPDN